MRLAWLARQRVWNGLPGGGLWLYVFYSRVRATRSEVSRLDIEAILAIIFVLGVPSMALATHVVLRPLIREYAKLKGLKADKDEIEARMVQLEDVVHDLDRQVTRLIEAEQFRRELESGRRRTLPEP